MTESIVRAAVEADLTRIVEIYNRYIEHTHVSFEVEPHTVEGRSEWFSGFGVEGPHRAFVAEVDGEVVGFAYSRRYRNKGAYATSVETTVVLDSGFTGSGIGGPLFATLMTALETAGVHRAYAVVALPNAPSTHFHERFGYRSIGIQTKVGRKFGKFWDTELLERRF